MSDSGEDQGKSPQDSGQRPDLPITLARCSQCNAPLYLIQPSPVIYPAHVEHLKALAEQENIPAFLALPFAVYQVWPLTRVLTRDQYFAVNEEIRQAHLCSGAAGLALEQEH